MVITIVLLILAAVLVWHAVELFQSSTLNEFLDKKIMRRYRWIWLPVYALWRLSHEVLAKKKK